MDTNALKKFAQSARNLLIDQVTARLDMVLAEGAAARREHPKAIARLEAAANSNRAQVIEQAAYTWFNRFTALRFMDVTGLTNPRVVSPADGATRPEILAEAMAGNLPDRARPEIAEYLNGTRPAHDGQAEAYRLLLIHACNEWHGAMPYMFERADLLDRAEDYTELLMPDDLLSPDSILARLREVMTEEACQDVEIIGWLYQFYISEKKDQVFAGLKKNQKITAENIPAATQLFTPHWIVRYLVENSLGRLWLLNRPQSNLAAKMDYYIAPEEPETDFLKISRAEEIKICDPACGSGHMLTYAFDLLYEIYAEEGHDAAEIPGLILQHNLTGIEIDDRAGALAAFALSMKAAARLGRRRFLRMEAKPDIVVLQNVSFTPAEMQDVAAVVGKDLFTDELRVTLGQFEQAKNFGSLIVPKLRDPAEALRLVEARDFGSDLLLTEVQERVVAVLRMAEALSPKYHVVVANPPYMGSANFNPALKKELEKGFKVTRSDLYAIFLENAVTTSKQKAYVAMVTMQGWMFTSSYEGLRDFLLKGSSVVTLAQLGSRAFSEISGEIVQAAAFVVKARTKNKSLSVFIRLTDGRSEEKDAVLRSGEQRFQFQQGDFSIFPQRSMIYWASGQTISAFNRLPTLDDFGDLREGIHTGKNDDYLRLWWETQENDFSFNETGYDSIDKNRTKWFPYNKGGKPIRWYGGNEWVISFDKRSRDQMAKLSGHVRPSQDLYFKEGATWPDVSSASFGAKFFPSGYLFDAKGPVYVGKHLPVGLAAMNSKPFLYMCSLMMPTLSFKCGTVKKVPVPSLISFADAVSSPARSLISVARQSDSAFETSWDFTTLPLLAPDHRSDTLTASYARLRVHWKGMTDEMQRLEEENNRIFIDAYGLQDELTPEVPIEEITLTCNPAYRYGVKGTEAEREARLREETVAELLHYAVGCMFGRYSLDAPGLILANQGEGIEEYLARVPEPTFAPDRDNVIPVLDADWFADDIVTRARDFLRVTFGEARFRENLAFVETALGKDLRRWFTKDFFDYHVRRYKKRPIYWMFSSPKGSFNALIYMHRYRPDTVSVVLNQYVREFIHKLEVERARLEKLADDPAATPAQQTKAQKETATVIKQIAELTEWERDVVYPMAQKKIAIDLDDGVKRNYPLFAGALKPIKGLEAADD